MKALPNVSLLAVMGHTESTEIRKSQTKEPRASSIF
jgi:hypothetical protein